MSYAEQIDDDANQQNAGNEPYGRSSLLDSE